MAEKKEAAKPAADKPKAYKKAALTETHEFTIKHENADRLILIDAEGKKLSISQKEFEAKYKRL